MKQLASLAAVCFLSLLVPPASRACPFCPPSFQRTILQEIDDTAVAVLARLVRPPRADAAAGTSTGYRVVCVLRGAETVRTGDTVDLPLKIPSPTGSVHLLLAQHEDPAKWQRPRGLSPAAQEFLRAAALLPIPQGSEQNGNAQLQRLAFMVPHLVSNDAEIARAAHAEFAAAPYPSVKRLAAVLNPHTLRAWIELETGEMSDRRLLFTLLAVCGRVEDSDFVKAALDDRVARDKLAELDAIISAYLTLTGEEGLDIIDRQLVQSEIAPSALRRAVATALRFHADQETVIPRDRVIASCRMMLNDPLAADYVIRDLTRWEDWESHDAIVRLWNDHAAEHRWLRQPITSYLAACPPPRVRSRLAGCGQLAGEAGVPSDGICGKQQN